MERYLTRLTYDFERTTEADPLRRTHFLDHLNGSKKRSNPSTTTGIPSTYTLG